MLTSTNTTTGIARTLACLLTTPLQPLSSVSLLRLDPPEAHSDSEELRAAAVFAT